MFKEGILLNLTIKINKLVELLNNVSLISDLKSLIKSEFSVGDSELSNLSSDNESNEGNVTLEVNEVEFKDKLHSGVKNKHKAFNYNGGGRMQSIPQKPNY